MLLHPLSSSMGPGEVVWDSSRWTFWVSLLEIRTPDLRHTGKHVDTVVLCRIT